MNCDSLEDLSLFLLEKEYPSESPSTELFNIIARSITENNICHETYKSKSKLEGIYWLTLYIDRCLL